MKYLIVTAIFFVIASCATKEENSEEAKAGTQLLTVAASNYPLHYFTLRIGGSEVNSIFPIPSNVDPAHYNPQSDEIQQFQLADIIFFNGADYEKWAKQVSLVQRKITNTSASFEDQYIEEKGVSHTHGPEGEHAHGEMAFTTWLNLEFAIQQAAAIKAKLSESLPDNKEVININFENLSADLKSLDERIKAAVPGDLTIFSSHPVYQYFGKAYGLEIISMHWEPEEDLTDEQWEDFTHLVQDTHTKMMLWEGEPTRATRQKLEEHGFQVMVFSPCANVPEEGDFMTVMQENIKGLEASFVVTITQRLDNLR